MSQHSKRSSRILGVAAEEMDDEAGETSKRQKRHEAVVVKATIESVLSLYVGKCESTKAASAGRCGHAMLPTACSPCSLLQTQRPWLLCPCMLTHRNVRHVGDGRLGHRELGAKLLTAEERKHIADLCRELLQAEGPIDLKKYRCLRAETTKTTWVRRLAKATVVLLGGSHSRTR